MKISEKIDFDFAVPVTAGIDIEMSPTELLEHSFIAERKDDGKLSRLEFLSEFIFDFTTYNNEMSELFASKALDVCAALNDRGTFEYIKDADNYRWFLIMVNMPFFANRLDWGTSINGAWWKYEDQTLKSTGIWCGDEQALSVMFTSDEWQSFIAALIAFVKVGVTPE